MYLTQPRSPGQSNQFSMQHQITTEVLLEPFLISLTSNVEHRLYRFSFCQKVFVKKLEIDCKIQNVVGLLRSCSFNSNQKLLLTLTVIVSVRIGDICRSDRSASYLKKPLPSPSHVISCDLAMKVICIFNCWELPRLSVRPLFNQACY